MNKKIVIVGAGPIGCFTAQLLRIHGLNPLLIEEHSEVGRPLHCTGLIGSKLFSEKLPFKISPLSILNTINGAVIHFDNQHFIIKRKKVAFVVDRERFDKELSKNLNISYNNKFLGVEKAGSHYVVETERDELFADIVIGADGANSAVRKILNENGTTRQFRGMQLKMRMKARFKDMVQVYLKKAFFIWVVPEREDIVRIGTISENPYKDLQNFLEESSIKGEVLDRFGGMVSIGICEKTVKDGIALVGDAACQLKPLSYGGVYFGIKAAVILGECIEENRLKDYDFLWKKELEQEIKFSLKIKEIYNQLSGNDLGKLFRLLKSQKSLIEELADFENHSRFILEIIKRPSLYPKIGDLFRILFKTIF